MDETHTDLSFRNEIVETEENNILTYEYTYNGGGIAVGDVNNDGLPDIYFSGNTVPNKLFLNKGGWKFKDVTQLASVAGRNDWKTGVTFVDINGDGWLDIYQCYSGNAPKEGFNRPVIADHPKRSNQLFINGGCEPGGVPVFVERAKDFGLDATGTFSTQAYFLDYDLDGDLDMFLLNHANMFYRSTVNVSKLRNLRHPYFGNKLYKNDNGKFIEISESANIHGSGLNFGLSASIADINIDGWPDIYVTNDYDEQDFCYINNRNGTFSEVSHKIFNHLSKFAMGSDVADINNDGLPEIFVADMLPEDNRRQKLLKGGDEFDKHSIFVDSGYHHQYMRNTLQLNRGFDSDTLPRFSEIAQMSGLSATDWSWAPLFADFDNDGLKDLFVTNGYLRDYTNLDFQKYTIHQEVQKANDNNHPLDLLASIQKIPTTKLKNYIFKNDDGIHFSNASEPWGLEKEAISNAAAYGDFDNDGDYDLVIGNLNDDVTILQNHQDKIQKNNYIKIRLIGKGANTQALGSKIVLSIDDGIKLTHEVYYTRGYQSSVEPVLTIGTGNASLINSVEVVWPDQSVSVLNNVSANQTLTLHQSDAVPERKITIQLKEKLLTDITEKSHVGFTHQENVYVDFKHQKLLPYQLSRLGGKLAIGDVNNDGNDDVFFGGAHRSQSRLFLGIDGGAFQEAPGKPWEAERYYEDVDAAFFDADGDHNVDLYVLSGGSEFELGDPLYQDRLYKGDGKGGFQRLGDALPNETASGSCVIAADFDKDGDIDLFVGNRLVPGLYPASPKSVILRNDTKDGKILFTDVTKQYAEPLLKAGMVTSAVWADVNKDSWPDLVLVGDWMPVRIFQNNNGKGFTEITKDEGLADSNGWWTTVFAGDVDNDGDLDLLAGNAGRNMQIKASSKEPVSLYAQDINNDASIEPVLCYFNQGKSYPLPSRDELLEQVPTLKKRFTSYALYADATINDIVGEQHLAKSFVLQANTFESVWLENNGQGKFQIRPLPPMAQLSCLQGFVQTDVDGDAIDEVLAVGNFYPYRVQLGQSDASKGLLLKFREGSVTEYKSDHLLSLSGDIRDIGLLKSKNSPIRIVVSRNNDAASVYKVKDGFKK
ncbi:VCBS repeat-containing protein [Chryseosolibacter indicus]|uniref:VCBS repeat-containing protein n=1 Tax=Chryseosolibacter indicus TaxID=2782351 RepID=A0ABS5VTB0_9BACT|nr:VCBS repeat-containing protein [Chryseosolibacter indicus]MBT1704075.1 VCBS repeat-containing protein [Chryseosolibacter indicus]